MMKHEVRTKAVRWIFSLALMIGLMTAMSVTVWADEEPYNLWVGGVQVTSDNLVINKDDDPAISGEATFDPTNNKLTLNNFSYTGGGHKETVSLYWYYLTASSPIFWKENNNLVIELEGENKVDASNGPATEAWFGVLCYSGNLELVGKDSHSKLIALGSNNGVESAGIYVYDGELVINSGNVDAKGFCYGILSDSDMVIGEEAGEIFAEGTDTVNYSAGLYISNGGLNIYGGTINAIADRNTGIFSYYGIEIGEKAGKITGKGILYGISGWYGRLIIKGGVVNAEGSNSGLSCYPREEGASISISGEAVVTAKATGEDGKGIDTINDVVIDGGTVHVISSGEGGIGIYSNEGSVTVGDKVLTFIAKGTAVAINNGMTVKNAVAGLGWTDFEGTEGETELEIAKGGQVLDSYKMVQFPTVHKHTCTYEASEAVITATCNAMGNCGLTNNQITLTIEKPELTVYGDKVSAEANLAGLDEFNAATGNDLTAKSIKYYKAVKDGETYVKDGEALAAAPKDAGDYIAEITVADDEQTCTASVGYTIDRASQTAPAAPVVTATTSDSITVKTVRGVEFSIDGVNWQTSGIFTGLNPDATYVIQARKVATVNHNASPASKTVVNTPSAQSQPDSWRFGLRLFNVFNILNSAKQTVTSWNPLQPRTIWTPWWVRR